MNSYNEILKQIKDDLMNEYVISDNDVISLYDLYNILNLEFEPLRNVIDNKKILKNKVLFSIKPIKNIYFSVDSKQMNINIKLGYDQFEIIKKYNNDNLYFSANNDTSKKHINKFVQKHYDEIIYMFSVLEKYSKLILHFKEPIKVFEKSDYYNFYIINKFKGKVDIVPNLLNADQLNYYIKEELYEIIEENKYDLAKKIKLNINDLDDVIQKIVNEYFDLENKSSKNVEKIKV